MIPLTQGQVALVDVADYDRLSAHLWYAVWEKKTRLFYARRKGPVVDGYRRTYHMHREVLGLAATDQRTPDHKESGLTLDNRRSNLRIADDLQQARNRRTFKKAAKGIDFRPDRNRYRVRVGVNHKQKLIGYCKTLEQAIDLRRLAVRELHGEFARTT